MRSRRDFLEAGAASERKKDKCKELGISGFSKLKKPELIPVLESEFLKLIPILREKKVNELKNKSRTLHMIALFC